MDVVNYALSNKIKKYVDKSIEDIPDDKIIKAVDTYLDENPIQPVDIAYWTRSKRLSGNTVNNMECEVIINGLSNIWHIKE